MKYLIAIVLACLISTPALAANQCIPGSPDMFEFIKWEFKNIDNHWVEISLTYHNKLNQAFAQANIGVVVDGHPQFEIHNRKVTKPSSDATATEQLGMRMADLKELQSLTPKLLCVEWTFDENGTRTSY